MKIQIEIKGPWRNSPEAKEELKGYASQIKEVLKYLSKSYPFKLPKTLIIRPLYSHRGRKGYFGRAYPQKGTKPYQIALNLPKLRDSKKERVQDVIFHESCHVAEYIIHGRMGHGPAFKALYGLKYRFKEEEDVRKNRMSTCQDSRGQLWGNMPGLR